MALISEKVKNWGVNEGIYVIKPKNSIINSKFLYYYLNKIYSFYTVFKNVYRFYFKAYYSKSIAIH